MSTKAKIVGSHQQRAYRHRVGYRPNSTHDRLSELVSAACDFFFIRKGMKLDRSFYFGRRK